MRQEALRKRGWPWLLWSRLLFSLVPRFLGAMGFFLALFMLADLFSSLWRFLSLDAPFLGIVWWLVLGLPKHINEVLPVAFLFAASWTISETYALGELTVIFGSGIGLRRYSVPLIGLSLVLAAGGLVFQEAAAIPALNVRELVSRELLKQSADFSANDITRMSSGGAWIYHASFYDDTSKLLTLVDIVGRDSSFVPEKRISADSAKWDGDKWTFINARIFSRLRSGVWTEESLPVWSDPVLNEAPASFRSIKNDLSAMNRRELASYTAFLKGAGLPSAAAVLEAQRRLAFSCAPLIVAFLAAAFGGLFRKNTLLMSLLYSLGIAVCYYVTQMLGSLMAKTGILNPYIGAWAPTALFLALAYLCFRLART